jgi:hypothetical protein
MTRVVVFAGPLLKLHWYVYSMATPVNYKLTLLDTTAEESTATAHTATDSSRKQQQQRHLLANTGLASSSSSSSSSTEGDQNARVADDHDDGAAISFSGAGFAHMEKNWGDAFPEQWVWAQGISSNGQVSCTPCCCSGDGCQLNTVLQPAAVLVLRFPEQWVWAQGISSNGQVSEVLLCGCCCCCCSGHGFGLETAVAEVGKPRDSDMPKLHVGLLCSLLFLHLQSSFVLAGGSLPIKHPSKPWAASALKTLLSSKTLPFPSTTSWREEPLAFAFSLHSPAVNLTIDPSHPGWVSAFEPCSCCSSMAIKLTGWGHEVVLRIEAQQGSFAALPCPTEEGFLVSLNCMVAVYFCWCCFGR